MSIPTLLVDSQQLVVSNKAAQDLLALPANSGVELKHVITYVRKVDEQPLPLAELMEETTSKPRRLLIVTPDRNPVLVSMVVVGLQDNAQKDYWLITFEREQAEVEADSSLSALQLLRTLNHELKQPMTSLKASLFLLKRKVAVSPEVKGKIEAMDTHLNQMSRMLTNTVTAFKLSQGYLGGEHKRTSIDESVSKALEVIQPLFPQHGFSITKAATLQVEVDAYLLQLAIQEILMNAAVYSPAESVITIALTKADDRASIAITDSGAGMGAGTMETALLALSRGQEEQPIPYAMGLGLYMAKRIIESTGGSLAIASTLGKGTTVTLTLPTAAL